MSKTDHSHPLWQLLDRLQMDVASMNAKLVEVRSLVAQMQLAPPTRHVCGECGAVHRHQHALDEHRYRCHGGPVPEHYIAAEMAAGFEPEPRVSERQERIIDISLGPRREERATR